MGLGSNISIDFVMNISIFDIYDKITSVLIGSLAFYVAISSVYMSSFASIVNSNSYGYC